MKNLQKNLDASLTISGIIVYSGEQTDVFLHRPVYVIRDPPVDPHRQLPDVKQIVLVDVSLGEYFPQESSGIPVVLLLRIVEVVQVLLVIFILVLVKLEQQLLHGSSAVLFDTVSVDL